MANNNRVTDGQFYKVIDKDTGAVITMGELSDTNTLSTIHNVEFISEEQYEAERPKPEALSETKMI
ncbi:hypothetical protein HPJ32_03215 [Acinetobacter baumannii]|uniref:hypothetical protein n=1 Tax=Acinetobacter baumannii TaxID=470 RepID=UPI0016603B1C|nr:hypothetical protein [Acinetobacter baumannii]MBD0530586.1 hypothetical protein [Acinetobacter baumannii]MCZ3263156.1 hypothetical protein [Acinetobacter baumannii]